MRWIFHSRKQINESKNQNYLIFALVSLLSMGGISAIALAAFEDTGTGARPAALGGAYVALGNDTLSLMYNPAGLARIAGKSGR